MDNFDSSGWTGDNEANNERLRSLIGQGAKIAGGAVGAAIGFLAGGPGGAAALGAAGVVASEALAHIGDDISQRLLGPREKVRVGALIALSAARIKDRIEAGDQIRDDGFFDERPDTRSNADEIAESLITKAQRESEEKKIPFMASLLSNTAFEAWITVPLAQQLAKNAEALTYRQLCILAAIAKMNKGTVRQKSYRDQHNFLMPLLDILYEIYDLIQRGLVAIDGVAPLGITDIEPNKLILQGLGVHLYNLMSLSDIDNSEIVAIIDTLR